MPLAGATGSKPAAEVRSSKRPPPALWNSDRPWDRTTSRSTWPSLSASPATAESASVTARPERSVTSTRAPAPPFQMRSDPALATTASVPPSPSRSASTRAAWVGPAEGRVAAGRSSFATKLTAGVFGSTASASAPVEDTASA